MTKKQKKILKDKLFNKLSDIVWAMKTTKKSERIIKVCEEEQYIGLSQADNGSIIPVVEFMKVVPVAFSYRMSRKLLNEVIVKDSKGAIQKLQSLNALKFYKKQTDFYKMMYDIL